MSPQTQKILRLLIDRGEEGLTPLEALDLVGTMRLSARIMEIKEDGYNIVNVGGSLGRKHFAKYVLRKKKYVQVPMWENL